MSQKLLLNYFVWVFLSFLPNVLYAQNSGGPIGTALAAELGGKWYMMRTEEGASQIPFLAYIIHSGFISGYQNRYGDNLKPPTNVYHRMTA